MSKWNYGSWRKSRFPCPDKDGNGSGSGQQNKFRFFKFPVKLPLAIETKNDWNLARDNDWDSNATKSSATLSPLHSYRRQPRCRRRRLSRCDVNGCCRDYFYRDFQVVFRFPHELTHTTGPLSHRVWWERSERELRTDKNLQTFPPIFAQIPDNESTPSYPYLLRELGMLLVCRYIVSPPKNKIHINKIYLLSKAKGGLLHPEVAAFVVWALSWLVKVNSQKRFIFKIENGYIIDYKRCVFISHVSNRKTPLNVSRK